MTGGSGFIAVSISEEEKAQLLQKKSLNNSPLPTKCQKETKFRKPQRETENGKKKQIPKRKRKTRRKTPKKNAKLEAVFLVFPTSLKTQILVH